MERTEEKPRIKPEGRGVIEDTRKGIRIHCRESPVWRMEFVRTQYGMKTREETFV